jgi:hypothetical protein
MEVLTHGRDHKRKQKEHKAWSTHSFLSKTLRIVNFVYFNNENCVCYEKESGKFMVHALIRWRSAHGGWHILSRFCLYKETLNIVDDIVLVITRKVFAPTNSNKIFSRR